MYWHDTLYLGKSCIRRLNRLKYKITNRELHPTMYLIALPANPRAVLELIPSTMLMQKAYPRDGLYIIGMGSSRSEGIDLMQRIIEDVYRERQDFNVAEYLKATYKED